MPDTAVLTQILDRIDAAAVEEYVSVQDMLDQVGNRSMMPIVLMISLILVSPISGIPGLSTLSALVIMMVMGQALFQRDRLWLPGFLRNRRVRSDRLRKAVIWLRTPAAWVDRNTHPRLRILTNGPLRWLTLALCMLVPMIWPFFELVPFTATIGASSVALMSFGLLTRDGLYVLAGYGVVGIIASGLFWLLQAGT